MLFQRDNEGTASPAPKINSNRKRGKYDLENHYIDTRNCFNKVDIYKYYA